MSVTGSPKDDVTALVADLISPKPDPATGRTRSRGRTLAALIPPLTRRARKSGIGAVTAGRWLADEVIDLAPRLSFRDAKSLHEQYPGMTDVEIAQKIISTSMTTTAALGAAAGALASVEFVSAPLLFAAPIQLAAETLTVTAVELKMVAELHEILGLAASGSAAEKASAYLMSWVRRRAVRASAGSVGVTAVLGSAAKKELRSQLMRRVGRSATSFAPFLAGAIAGAEVNRRATKQLGEVLLAELRTMHEDRWFRAV